MPAAPMKSWFTTNAAPQTVGTHQPCLCDLLRTSFNGLLSACVVELARFHQEVVPNVQKTKSGSVFVLPVWCLRWTHDSVNPSMVFGSGRAQDKSIYDMLHDLTSERLLPSQIEKLHVVFDGGKFYSLSNRRLAALKMFQALRQHEPVYATCTVYFPNDVRISQKYISAKTTADALGDGQGLVSTRTSEAYHMGRPLFRCAEEFYTPTTAVTPVTSTGTQCPELEEPVQEAGGRDSSSHEQRALMPVARGSRKGRRRPRKDAEVTREGGEHRHNTAVEEGGAEAEVDSSGCPVAQRDSCEGANQEREAEYLGVNHARNDANQTDNPAEKHFPARELEEGEEKAPQEERKEETEMGEEPVGQIKCHTLSSVRPPPGLHPGGFDSDNEGDGMDQRDSDDEENKCEPCCEYLPKVRLEADLLEQGNISHVVDIKGKLVWGTFMVTSGSDFKHRRCRAEVFVERGPANLLRSRVNIIGIDNRNRAWHFDKCWVRIIRAKIKSGKIIENVRELVWQADYAERCSLDGMVVRAEPSLAPRQKEVVCLRSRYVRHLRTMTFRVINGKFPLIQVKWNPEEPSPSLRDLHLIEILKWEESLPQGRYLHPLDIDNTNSDANLLYAISKSLNYCDWEEGEEAVQFPVPAIASSRTAETRKCSRKRLQVKEQVVGIQHAGWPCSMAFSTSTKRSQRGLEIHLCDVNEYLDAVPAGQCQQLEEMMRRRAVGVRFVDFQGDPLEASRPLLPKDIEDASSFQAQKEVLAVTFWFPFDQETLEVDIDGAEWYESIVTCQRVLSHQAVEGILRGQLAQIAAGTRVRIHDPSGQHEWDGKEGLCTIRRPETNQWAVQICGEQERSFRRENLHVVFGQGDQGVEHTEVAAHSELLRVLYAAIQKLEQNSMGNDTCAVFEHLEPDFASSQKKSEREGFAASLLAGCSFLVNRCAGGLLGRSELWAALLSTSSAEHIGEVPMLMASRPDARSWAAALRLLPLAPSSDAQQMEVRVPDVVRELQRIVGQKGLHSRQRRCLQQAFLRRVLGALPHSSYRLVKPDSARATRAIIAGNFFNREEVFSVASPLMRYLDVLGMRALKLKKGWRPAHKDILRPTWEQLQESLERTNLRQDASRFAKIIFNQLTVMRFLEKGGRRFTDCLVGAVTPASFDVLVPLTSSSHLSLMVPVSALRGPSCMVMFDAGEDVCLKCAMDSTPLSRNTQWSITPWGCKVSCLISRNFAQPVQQHATLSANIVSDITFTACMGRESTDVSLAVGHRMFPEVFSQCPDLDQWYLIDSDINAYVETWYKIRQCQIHAGAAESNPEPRRVPVALKDLDWPDGESSTSYIVKVNLPTKPGATHDRVHRGDLAILHIFAVNAQEVILYGTITAEPEQASDGVGHSNPCGSMVEVQVELSQVSSSAKKQEQEVVNMCVGATVQFIPVLQMDKKSLERLLTLLRDDAIQSSPILTQLTGRLTPKQKKENAESRPLASLQQINKALQGIPFRATGTALNKEQCDAARLALQRKFSVVQGPPGTGKTSFLVHLVASLLNLEGDASLQLQAPTRSLRHPVTSRSESVGKVLICAPSNQAADEVLHRLIRGTNIPHKYITRVYARCIEAADGCKYGGVKQLDEKCDVVVRKDLQEHALHFKTQNVEAVRRLIHVGRSLYDRAYERAEVEVLAGARVVVTTCMSALFHAAWGNRTMQQEQEKRRTLKFATVVIDEAGQATELDVVLPALFAQQRVVVVGDEKQLGPVVKENNLCRAYLQALEKPMLERLCESPQLAPTRTMFCKQYRMHKSLRAFPSKHFYNSQLEDYADLPANGIVPSVWPKQDEHITFIDCRTPHEFGTTFSVGNSSLTTKTSMLENNTSVKNVGEASVVAAVFERLLRRGKCNPAEIGILTHYRAQKEEIITKLKQKVGEEAVAKTTVGTVHTFQGSERKFIIVSFVRSVAEGVALAYSPEAITELDIIISVRANNLALRQTCEANIGIVNNSKALNVSLTRAKSGMVCVGNRHVLESCQDFFDLCQDLAERGCILSQQEFEELGKA